MADIRYPPLAKDRGPGFWLRPKNLLASQRKLRLDYSNEWRYSFGSPPTQDRSVPISALIKPAVDGSFRFVILGDTGEGDRSQYGLVPLIRALQPNFVIINGDVAYPSGRAGSGNRNDDDFLCGFFEPYRNLGIPIWATPGNHEYYSPGNGQEFYEIFCTRKFDRLWSGYGLPHTILQPGMFWELRDDRSKLVVIGVDSGKTANLDGDNDWWQIWKRHIEPDKTQHSWLDNRLRRAQESGDRVLVLFHIPALVNEDHKEKYLNTLHRIIAGYPCVQVVICGHEHNFQNYSANTFERYLKAHHTTPLSPVSSPHYFVAGSSGAALAGTGFRTGAFPSERFPDPNEWREVASIGRRAVSGLKLDSTVFGQVVGRLEESAAEDGDAAVYLSLILVDVKPRSAQGEKMKVVVTPVLMDDLQHLFGSLGQDVIVNVTDPNPPVDQNEVEKCLRRHQPVELKG